LRGQILCFFVVVGSREGLTAQAAEPLADRYEQWVYRGIAAQIGDRYVLHPLADAPEQLVPPVLVYMEKGAFFNSSWLPVRDETAQSQWVWVAQSMHLAATRS
jgi:hypothetical protein